MFSFPAFKMFQPLQTFGSTLLKMKIVNNADFYQVRSIKKEVKKQLKMHREYRKNKSERVIVVKTLGYKLIFED